MKVLHIVPALFDPNGGVRGGGERYSLELARHMADHAETTLLTFGAADRVEQAGRLRIRVLGGAIRVRGQEFNPLSAAVLPELWRADVVHCHQQHVLLSSLSAIACRSLGKKIFVSDAGGGGWDLSAYVSTDRWYDGHLHLSQFSLRESRHHERKWAHVIYGGVDSRKFSADPSVVKETGAIFVGRLLPHKGIDDLLRAIPDGMKAEIVGPALDDCYLADLRNIGIGKNIVFHHDCDDAALVSAYRRAQAIVLPSVYRNMYGGATRVPELLGQTLLEGMACGLPAICTDVASMPEVVEDGRTGFVVAPNSPAMLRQRLEWLRDHPLERQAMGSAAREHVLERFTWPQVVKRCLEIYRVSMRGRKAA